MVITLIEKGFYMSNFIPIIGYTPGLIGRISEMHAQYYAKRWHFGSYFEAKVASGLSCFINAYDESKDRIWSLNLNNTIEGSIAIDGSTENENMAHLRWFIVSDKLRGKGAGNYLMQQAVSFCRQAGFAKIYLWTFEGLDAARHLYEKYGFQLVEQFSGDQWGTTVREQRFEAQLTSRPEGSIA